MAVALKALPAGYVPYYGYSEYCLANGPVHCGSWVFQVLMDDADWETLHIFGSDDGGDNWSDCGSCKPTVAVGGSYLQGYHVDWDSTNLYLGAWVYDGSTQSYFVVYTFDMTTQELDASPTATSPSSRYFEADFSAFHAVGGGFRFVYSTTKHNIDAYGVSTFGVAYCDSSDWVSHQILTGEDHHTGTNYEYYVATWAAINRSTHAIHVFAYHNKGDAGNLHNVVHRCIYSDETISDPVTASDDYSDLYLYQAASGYAIDGKVFCPISPDGTVLMLTSDDSAPFSFTITELIAYTNQPYGLVGFEKSGGPYLLWDHGSLDEDNLHVVGTSYASGAWNSDEDLVSGGYAEWTPWLYAGNPSGSNLAFMLFMGDLNRAYYCIESGGALSGSRYRAFLD